MRNEVEGDGMSEDESIRRAREKEAEGKSKPEAQKSPAAPETQKDSAATRMVKLARERFEFKTDIRTGKRFAFSVGALDSPPIRWERFGDALAGLFEKQEGKAASGDARRSALAVLVNDQAEPEDLMAPLSLSEEEQERLREECLKLAGDLLTGEDILAVLSEDVVAGGFAGPTDPVELLFLVMLSRYFRQRRVGSASPKGESAVGKSFVADRAVEFLPPEDVYIISSGSPLAWAYSPRDFRHKVIYMAEASALESDGPLAAIARTLLTEGKLAHETVREGQWELLEKEGPTALLTTTTKIALEKETDTRLLGIPMDESPEQTKRILDVQAQIDTGKITPPDLTRWHALQRYLVLGECEVLLPEEWWPLVAELTRTDVAVRVRRDFPLLGMLVRAHALLHRETRETKDGKTVATLADYEKVHKLTTDVFSIGVGMTLRDGVREVVEAVLDVAGATDSNGESIEFGPMSIAAISQKCGQPHTTATRNVEEAYEKGYLIDGRRYSGARHAASPGDMSLPETNGSLFPDPDFVREAMRAATHSVSNPPENGGDLGIMPANPDEYRDCESPQESPPVPISPGNPGDMGRRGDFSGDEQTRMVEPNSREIPKSPPKSGGLDTLPSNRRPLLYRVRFVSAW
jgi:hypothetical protein